MFSLGIKAVVQSKTKGESFFFRVLPVFTAGFYGLYTRIEQDSLSVSSDFFLNLPGLKDALSFLEETRRGVFVDTGL